MSTLQKNLNQHNIRKSFTVAASNYSVCPLWNEQLNISTYRIRWMFQADSTDFILGFGRQISRCISLL